MGVWWHLALGSSKVPWERWMAASRKQGARHTVLGVPHDVQDRVPMLWEGSGACRTQESKLGLCLPAGSMPGCMLLPRAGLGQCPVWGQRHVSTEKAQERAVQCPARQGWVVGAGCGHHFEGGQSLLRSSLSFKEQI